VRIYEFPFTADARQDADRAFTPDGSLFRIRDGRARSVGAWGKRHGYSTVDRTGLIVDEPIQGAPTAIGEFAGREALAAGDRVYTRIPHGLWQENGRTPRFRPRRTHWIHFNDANNRPVEHWDLAAAGSIWVVVFSYVTHDGRYRVAVHAFDSYGNRVFAETLGGVSAPLELEQCRAIACGGNVIITAVNRDLFIVMAWTFNVATLTLPEAPDATLGPIATFRSGYDISEFGAGNFLSAVHTADGVLRVENLTAAFVVQDFENVTIAPGFARPSIYGVEGVGIWGSVVVCTTFGGVYSSYSLTRTVTLDGGSGPTAYGTAGLSSESAFVYSFASGGTHYAWQIWRERSADAEQYSINSRFLALSGAVSGPVIPINHMQMGSLPFDGSINGYRAWMHTDNGQVVSVDNELSAAWAFQRKQSLETVDLMVGARPVLHPELTSDERSHFDVGPVVARGGGLPGLHSEGPWLPHVASIGSVSYHAAVVPIRTQEAKGRRPVEAWALVVYEYEPAESHSMLPAAGGGVVLNGHMQEVASSRIDERWDASDFTETLAPRGVENGFIRHPAILKLTPYLPGSTLDSGSLSSGFYQACVTYEYIDIDGRRHVSTPSNVVTFTILDTDVNRKAVLWIATYSAFERDLVHSAHETVVHVWCTAAGGETFYRVSRDQNTDPAYSDDPFLYFEIEVDPNIFGEILYTDGGIFSIQPAPSSRFGCVAGDRLALGGLFDPRVIEVSRFFRPQQPPEFTRAPPFRAVLPEPCTGLGFLDGQIVAFSERSIYLIDASNLPSDQGVPGLPTPVQVPTDVGCVPDTPVIQLPAGLVYQSRRGVFLLPRGFGPPQYLSGQVKEDLGTRRVRSAALVHYSASSALIEREYSAHYLYLGVVASDVIDYLLVLNLETMRFESRDIVHGGPAIKARVIGAWSGRCVLARNPIALEIDLVQESPTSFLDGWAEEGDITPRFVLSTGAIRPFGFASRGRFQMVRVIGQFVTPALVTLTTYPDGRGSTQYTQPSIDLTGTAGDRFEIDFTPRPDGTEVNSCQYDLEIVADSEGVLIHGLAFLVEPVPAFKGLPLARRV